MSTKYFNFNHEADLTPVEVNDETGAVTFEIAGQTQTYDNMHEFAEFYARARNVLPENLKNWELVADGDTYAYVLHAGTAGSFDLSDQELEQLGETLHAQGKSYVEITEILNKITQPDVAADNPSIIVPSRVKTNPYLEAVTEIVEDLASNNAEYDDDGIEVAQAYQLRVLKFALTYGQNTQLRLTKSDDVSNHDVIDYVADQFDKRGIESYEEYVNDYEPDDPDYDDPDRDYDPDELSDEYADYLQESFADIVDDYVQNYEAKYAERYGSHVPMKILLALVNDNFYEDTNAKAKLDQAQLAAQIAHRSAVVTVTNFALSDSGEFIDVDPLTPFDHVFVTDLNAQIGDLNDVHYFYVDHNFYVVKEVDEDVE